MWVLRVWEPGMRYRLPSGYLLFVRIGGIGRALVWIRCERVQREAFVMVLGRVPKRRGVGRYVSSPAGPGCDTRSGCGGNRDG